MERYCAKMAAGWGRLVRKVVTGGSVCGNRCVFTCSEVYAISSDLPLYHSDAKLEPARKFVVDSVSNAPGSAACHCGSQARCNCHLESYDPVLLIFYVGLG